MRASHATLCLTLVACCSACTSDRSAGSPEIVAREQGRTDAVDPMESFGRLIGGEWVLTVQSGNTLHSTSTWGPGRHSLRTLTHGLAADGSPWREVRVAYWHPGRGDVRTLSLTPFEHGVGEGVTTVDGDRWETVEDLFQTGRHRRVISRVTFESEDRCHSELLEEVSPNTIVPLTSWTILRSPTLSAVRPLPANVALGVSQSLSPLEPLIGHTWRSTDLLTTVEWIPLAGCVYLSAARPVEGGEPVHVLDAYVYRHTGTGIVRCLALTNEGGVYEGDLTVLGRGSLQLNLTGTDGKRDAERVVRLDIESDGSLHQRMWSSSNTAGAPTIDLRHTAATPAATPIDVVRPDPYFMQLREKSSPLMPRVIIRNMIEDRAGNIWFATFGGPIRYDRTTFTNFGEEVGLADRRIFSLLEDRSGSLWFGSITGGASRFDGRSFTRFTQQDGLGDNDVSSIFEDRDGNIWFGTGSGATRYDGKAMVNFTTEDGLVDNRVYAITQDRAGRIWFGTQGGVSFYDGASFTNLADHVGQTFENVRAMLVDRSGSVWFGGQQGAFRYEGTTLTTYGVTEAPRLNDGLLDQFVGSMMLDRAGNIWFGHPGHSREGAGGGATRFDGTAFTHFTNADGLNSTNVYCMLEDRAGNIWFGSVDAGACRFDGRTFTNVSAPDPALLTPPSKGQRSER